jgi:hypothetical protein
MRSTIEQLLILASAVLAVLPASLCCLRRRLRKPTSLLEVIANRRAITPGMSASRDNP